MYRQKCVLMREFPGEITHLDVHIRYMYTCRFSYLGSAAIIPDIMWREPVMDLRGEGFRGLQLGLGTLYSKIELLCYAPML